MDHIIGLNALKKDYPDAKVYIHNNDVNTLLYIYNTESRHLFAEPLQHNLSKSTLYNNKQNITKGVHEMRELPIGLQDFETLRREDMLYVIDEYDKPILDNLTDMRKSK